MLGFFRFIEKIFEAVTYAMKGFKYFMMAAKVFA